MLGIKGISTDVGWKIDRERERERAMNYIQYSFFQQKGFCRRSDARLSAICACVYKYELLFYEAMSVFER
jgi:hypothetical protein